MTLLEARPFDDGRTLILWRVHDEDRAEGFAVQTYGCENLDCTCEILDLRLHPFRGSGKDPAKIEKKAVADVTVDLATSKVEIHDHAASLSAGELGWIVSELAGTELPRLRERWRRHRGQLRGTQVPEPPAYERGNLVEYMDVFPCAWDLSVVHERDLHAVIDSYCLVRQCECRQVHLQFHNMSNAGLEAGGLCVSIDDYSEIAEREGATALALWSRIIMDKPADFFAKRYAEIRRVAGRDLPVPAKSAIMSNGRPRKVGRNEPCPCGSGKKYKRCCAR
ncbi:MAG: SEC-C metal-binding domain-containing protein [Planctomycetota bacterium]|nr:SEC-C metal-binding domain-containing protein [Planctomycetota bacterium]